jgi:uncharacterized phage infection (PIP) family protein YhgE
MASRRRQTITSSRGQPKLPKQPAEPKSHHVADPFLQDFLAQSFDPADYLNATLPALHQSQSRQHEGSTPLADLSSQAQTQISQLNAHTTRLTGTLTQLTDEILRSGSRLAYEVELLRGETLSFSEALSDGLHNDILQFMPQGTQEMSDVKSNRNVEEKSGSGHTEPSYISQLRTLTLVRSRLDLVVKTFGDAMEFVFPPSELSVSSSFLSVSAPEPGADSHSTEEKGQQVLKKLREDVSALLTKSNDSVEGIEKAAHRIEELKELLIVWKGTAEEKGRTKFIDGLAKMVEDRHKELLKEMEQGGRRDAKTDTSNESNSRRTTGSQDIATSETKPPAGYGLMSQWQRLRTGL